LRARRQVFTESLPSLQETTQAILEEENRVRQLTATIAKLEEQQALSTAAAGDFEGGITNSAIATIHLDAELRKARSSLQESTGMIETQTAAREQMLENIKRQVEAQRLIIEQEVEQATARKATANATRDQARAIREQAQAEAALQTQRQNQRDKEQADQDAADQAQAEKEEKKQSKQDADAKAAAKRKAAMEQGVQDSISATADLSMTLSDVVSEKNVKAARKLHRVSQAASLTQVAMNTSVAITKALAELGPVAGAVASVGIGLTGAAQAAAIAAHPAPTAHIGTGMPGSRDPLAPDERMSSGRRVLTTEASGPGGVANSMGTQLLNDVNTGRVQSSGRITAVIGRSHLDQELFRSGRRGTSRYARSLRTNPHPKPQGGY
jgi:chemotaxis protein histidine kinase CheA